MLGTPNGGSWAPMQVLVWRRHVRQHARRDRRTLPERQTRQLMARFPGLIQLQAGLTDGLKKSATWEELAEEDLRCLREKSVWHNLGLQLGSYAWGVPPQPVLDSAVKLREQLDGQVKRQLKCSATASSSSPACALHAGRL